MGSTRVAPLESYLGLCNPKGLGSSHGLDSPQVANFAVTAGYRHGLDDAVEDLRRLADRDLGDHFRFVYIGH
jgi:hypothetical protein